MIEISTNPDMERWAEFVYSHQYCSVFQAPEIAEVYKQTKNYEPISLTAADESTDEILGVLQGVLIKERTNILETLTTRSIIQGGPLFQNSPKGRDAAELLMNKYDDIARKKALYTEIRMSSDASEFNHVFSNCGYVFEEHFNALINLKNKSVEDLWEQIKRDKKRGIKKAEQEGIVIEECNNKVDIQRVYDLISETYENARIPLADRSLFESTFNTLVPKKRALFLFAKYKSEYIAAQVALVDGRTIHAWYTGSNKKYISYHPGDLLIWYLLKWGVENGFSIFDFGGGGTKTKNINLREYKARFGAEFPEYGRYKKIYSPIKYRIAEAGFEVYRRLLFKKGL